MINIDKILSALVPYQYDNISMWWSDRDFRFIYNAFYSIVFILLIITEMWFYTLYIITFMYQMTKQVW